MDAKDFISLIVTLLFVVGVGISIFITLKKNKEGKDEANKFLEGLKSALFEKMLDIIKNFNYDDFDDLVGIEVSVVEAMVKCAKNYIMETIGKSQSILSVIALKILTDEFIEQFVEKLINTIDIPATVEVQLGDKMERFNKEIVEEDKELEKEYSDSKIYFKEDNEIGELRNLSMDNIDELITTNKVEIIPPKDEEEPFNEEDSSMEIVSDDSTTYVDSRGRVHDKATGKFIKLNLEVPVDTEEEE